MEAKVERTPSVYSADDTVLFAIPKKGRIYEEVMSMLKGAGLDAKRPDRLDVATCKELPIKLVFLPAKDIPSYVMDGDVDLGISGEDVLQETLVGSGYDTATHVVTLLKLGIGKCKLCLQAPQALGATDPAVFTGKRIVTSFPAITRKYFDDLEAKVKKRRKFLAAWTFAENMQHKHNNQGGFRFCRGRLRPWPCRRCCGPCRDGYDHARCWLGGGWGTYL